MKRTMKPTMKPTMKRTLKRTIERATNRPVNQPMRFLHPGAWALAAVMAFASPCGWVHAATAEDNTPVQCRVQSAQLNFGRLHAPQALQVIGEGEAVLSCHNTANNPRRVTLTLSFPTLGQQAAVLTQGPSALPVHFYRDAQLSQRWGDDLNGAAAWTLALDMAAAEHRLLHVPVHAVLFTARGMAPGLYLGRVPLTLSTLAR